MNTIVHTPTNNLKDSIHFYDRLNFKQKSDDGQTYLMDSQVVIEVNESRMARPGLKLYRKSWDDVVKKLTKMTHVVPTDTGYVLADPGGTWVYLENGDSPVKRADFGEEPTILGNFAGLSLEVIDFHKAIQIWQTLGFKGELNNPDQGWIALKNEDHFGVSLMKPFACPHLFFNPSFTYFNGGNNLEVIEQLRKLEIPITEEITHFNTEGIVDNVIIRDPGGYGFFIFND